MLRCSAHALSARRGRRGAQPVGHDALIGRARNIVAFANLTADALLTEELADRAEEVELQTEQTVEALQHGEGRARAVPVVADQAADDQAVALFDPGLIVLAVRPAAREADVSTPAPGEQVLVEELAAVIAVPFAEREREARADVLDAAVDPVRVQAPDGLQLRPRRGHIHGDEGREVKAVSGHPILS